MISLPFSCTCSELKVHPKNWQSLKVSVKKDWYIYYRFYDPVFKENPKLGHGKLVIIKGMNHFKTIEERQAAAQVAIDKELSRLQNNAYNPITGKNIQVIQAHLDIESSTSFVKAIALAEKGYRHLLLQKEI